MRALAVMVVLVACGSPGPVKIDKGVRAAYSLDRAVTKDRAAALTEAVRVIKRRIEGARIVANVFARGDEIIVDFGITDPEQLSNARDLIGRTGKLEVKLVDNKAPLMRELFLRVEAHPDAVRRGVQGHDEQWADPQGGRHVDYYLQAPQRRDLETYVTDLQREEPTLAPAADHEIVYENVKRESGEQYWRTYYVERAPRLTNASIARARPSVQLETRQPTVRIDLDDKSAHEFGELTGRIIGEKIALVLDGRVVSAPIINGAVDRGRLTMFADDSRELAIVLDAGALPAPMILETLSEIDGDKLRYADENGNMLTAPR